MPGEDLREVGQRRQLAEDALVELMGQHLARQVLAHQLYESVFGKLPPLADFTEIFPGHGAGSLCGKAIGSRASSTLGYERRFNAALAERPEAQWISDLMDQRPLSPPDFARLTGGTRG